MLLVGPHSCVARRVVEYAESYRACQQAYPDEAGDQGSPEESGQCAQKGHAREQQRGCRRDDHPSHHQQDERQANERPYGLGFHGTLWVANSGPSISK